MQPQTVESLIASSWAGALIGWAALVAALFFAFRRPAANVFLRLPFVGMTEVNLIGHYTYGRISMFVGLVTLVLLLLRKPVPAGVRLAAFPRTPLAWFAGLCLLISAKIVLETFLYGLNADRSLCLFTGLTEVLFPCAVLLLSEMRLGPECTARDLLMGMFIFPVLLLVGYLPFALQQGLLASALNEMGRFSIGQADTINSARVLAIGAVASLLFLAWPRKRRQALVAWVCVTPIAAAFILLLLLNGTRQYLLGLSVFLFLWFWVLQSSRMSQWVGSIIALAGLGAIIAQLVLAYDVALTERLSGVELEADNRLEIWKEACEAVVEEPLLGTGFRNFGREVNLVNTQGEIIPYRETAHGAVQDVFTEQGIPLGIGFLAGCIHLVGRSWQAIRRDRRTTADKLLTIGCLGLLPPLLFSSIFLNATPVFLLLIMALARDSQGRSDVCADSM